MGLISNDSCNSRLLLSFQFCLAPTVFYKFTSAGFPPCFARWTQSFLPDRYSCMIFQNHKSCLFQFHQAVLQGFVLGPVVVFLFINNLLAFLPSFVCCSLNAEDLSIWSFSPSVPAAVEAIQGALIRLECWSEN